MAQSTSAPLCTTPKGSLDELRTEFISDEYEMADGLKSKDESLQIARRWCESKGAGWAVRSSLGEGGTAPVFEVDSPDGPRALKVYDAKFSAGAKGDIEYRRIEQQLALKGHECPHLLQVYEGGKLVLMPADGGDPRVAAILHGGPRSVAGPFTPDGKRVLISRQGTEAEILSVELSTGNAVPTGLQQKAIASWTLDSSGKRIFFSAGTAQNEIWIAENILPAK